MQGVFQEYWPQNTSGQYYWTVHPWHISVGGAPKREILKKAEIWEGHDETEAESMTKRLNDKGLPSFLACLIFLYPGYCFLCLDIPLFGLPWWLSGKESACQCRRHRFDPWSGRIPHASEQLIVCHNYWACALEPMVPKRSQCNEKPTHVAREYPYSLQLEKCQCSSEDPAQPKIDK